MTLDHNFNNCSGTATELLLTRRSSKTRHMVEPAPDRAQMRDILGAAMRVPDHGKLAPWRFVVIENDQQAALGARIAACYRDECPDGTETTARAMEAFANQSPVMVAVASRIDRDAPIPEFEQTLSCGAACQNMLVAAHSLGFVGCWLTGWTASSPGVKTALGLEATDRIAGFIFIGSPGRALKERPRPEFDDVVSYWESGQPG